MHTLDGILWVIVFMVLLMVNVAILVSSKTIGAGTQEPRTDFGLLLEATDEVKLEWWPEKSVSEIEIEEQTGDGVNVRFEQWDRLYLAQDGKKGKSYQELISSYITRLIRFLMEYFQIAKDRLEDPAVVEIPIE